MLRAISREIDAEIVGKRALVDASIAAGVDGQARLQLYTGALQHLDDSAQLSRYYSLQQINANREKVTDVRGAKELTEAFKIAKDAKCFDILAAALDNL